MRIENDGWRLELCPEFGGVVSSLQWRDRDIFRPARSLAAIQSDPREAAHYPCVPWFNRIYGGFEYRDRFVALDPVLDNEAALHGEGWRSPWNLVERSPVCAVIDFQYTPCGAGRFPFAFASRQTFRLTSAAFELSIRVRNDDREPAPFGLGLHPFFIRRPSTGIAFASADSHYKAGQSLPEETIDKSFCGFEGVAIIEDEDMRLRLTSDAPVLHLFAPAGGDFFCLEPVSHAAGAFGETILEPGQTLALSLSLAVELKGDGERAR